LICAYLYHVIVPATDKSTADSNNVLLPLSALDWAFAGTSQTSVDEDTGIVHAKWEHWIDSKTADAASVIDQGTMHSLGDGRSLEKGEMVSPSTGVMTPYEEVWQEVSPVEITGYGTEGKLNVVLILNDEAKKAKGMVVRVGQFCQAILRVDGREDGGEGEGKVFVERWEWSEEAREWQRRVKVGMGSFMPMGMAAMPLKGLEVGSEVVHGGEEVELRWRVVELSCFR
jgi:hypothetical protein